MTCYLGNHGRRIFVQREIPVAYKVTANTAKVYRREKILQIDIEYKAAVTVSPCVGDDGSFALEAMRNLILSALSRIDLISAVLKKDGEPPLQKFQGVNRGLYCACPTTSLRDFEGFVFRCRWLLE
jgi:hypothetical protein